MSLVTFPTIINIMISTPVTNKNAFPKKQLYPPKRHEPTIQRIYLKSTLLVKEVLMVQWLSS